MWSGMLVGMSVSPASRQSTIVSVHEHRAGHTDAVEQSSSAPWLDEPRTSACHQTHAHIAQSLSVKPVAHREIKPKQNTETVSASLWHIFQHANNHRGWNNPKTVSVFCFRDVRTYEIKRQLNNAAGGIGWNETADRQQFCFISVLFHDVRRA